MFHKEKSLFLFLLPGLILLLIFYVISFFGGIGYSITDGSKANDFVGLANYATLWQNRMFLLGSIGIVAALSGPFIRTPAGLIDLFGLRRAVELTDGSLEYGPRHVAGKFCVTNLDHSNVYMVEPVAGIVEKISRIPSPEDAGMEAQHAVCIMVEDARIFYYGMNVIVTTSAGN